MYMTMPEADALGQLLHWLGQPRLEREIRTHTGQQLLRILKADHYASYAWRNAACTFSDPVFLNMTADNLHAYEQYFQFRDPITPLLQRCRVPTCVIEIMPQRELMKTEFFNDFLAKDGLHHGVNLYAHQGGINIGDMRIWRGKRRKEFDQTAALVLAIVQPAFTAALQRAGTQVTPGDAGPLVVRPSPAPAPQALSAREQAIARCICRGLCDKQIAQELGIGFSTVRTHLARIFDKLGVRSRTQLMRSLAAQP